jgi:hypothetical protein
MCSSHVGLRGLSFSGVEASPDQCQSKIKMIPCHFIGKGNFIQKIQVGPNNISGAQPADMINNN